MKSSAEISQKKLSHPNALPPPPLPPGGRWRGQQTRVTLRFSKREEEMEWFLAHLFLFPFFCPTSAPTPTHGLNRKEEEVIGERGEKEAPADAADPAGYASSGRRSPSSPPPLSEKFENIAPKLVKNFFSLSSPIPTPQRGGWFGAAWKRNGKKERKDLILEKGLPGIPCS